MFSRWGAFVYRRRRLVAILAIVVAVGIGAFASQASSRLSSGGWLDPNSESAHVADTLASDFGAGRSTIVVLYRTTTAAQATSPEFQGAIATSLTAVKADPNVAGIVGYAETGDHRFISTANDAAYVVVELNATDEESVALVDPIRAAIAPPAGLHVPADRLRADHPGLGRPLGEGPPARRSGEPAVRRPHPHLRLRLDHRRRHAPSRRRLRDPDHARAHLLRERPDHDERLRPQHRDDARAGPLDRLQPLHRQPLPRGAAAGSDRRARPSRRRSRRAARPSRSPASRSPSACPASSSSRPRRCGASASPVPSSCSRPCSSP